MRKCHSDIKPELLISFAGKLKGTGSNLPVRLVQLCFARVAMCAILLEHGCDRRASAGTQTDRYNRH